MIIYWPVWRGEVWASQLVVRGIVWGCFSERNWAKGKERKKKWIKGKVVTQIDTNRSKERIIQKRVKLILVTSSEFCIKICYFEKFWVTDYFSKFYEITFVKLVLFKIGKIYFMNFIILQILLTFILRNIFSQKCQDQHFFKFLLHRRCQRAPVLNWNLILTWKSGQISILIGHSRKCCCDIRITTTVSISGYQCNSNSNI